MNDFRCWQCGAEPDLVEVTRFGEPEPSYLPGRYPPSDHICRPNPPSPGELVANAYAARDRVTEIWAS